MHIVHLSAVRDRKRLSTGAKEQMIQGRLPGGGVHELGPGNVDGEHCLFLFSIHFSPRV